MCDKPMKNYSIFTLFWIFPYAALTLKNRSWTTR